MKKIIAAFVVGLSVLLAGCDDYPDVSQQSVKQVQSQKAAEAANSIHFSANAEIDNIKKRLTLTSEPGLIGYILLLNDAGQPIMYVGIKGKITSSGKRLTKPYQKITCDKGQAYGECITASPNDEGTWGHSDQYVYFWSVSGQYYQWSGQYLYSDKPFRLSVKPLVIDIQEANKQ